MSAHLYINCVNGARDKKAKAAMAIYHLHFKIHGRSEGRSAVASAAYRSGSMLIDGRYGLVHDYRKKDVAHSEIMAPKDVPEWVFDRERLWNAVETIERRHDAQLAREAELALPAELSDVQQLALVRRFVSEQFVSHGMVADVNIHRNDPKNPHAHVLLTMRNISEAGFGKKERAWNDREQLKTWRREWGIACNRHLQRAGVAARVDERSHAERGLGILPGVKIGIGIREVAAHAASRLRYVAKRLQKHERILSKNAELVLRDPAVALWHMTYHESTFTRQDVQKWLLSHVSVAEHHKCLEAIMGSPQLIVIGQAKKDGPAWCTTVEMLRTEKSMLALSDALDQRGSRGLACATGINKACRKASLSDEQCRAVQYLVRETGDMALLEGWAGTGKSRLLGVARELWAQQGRDVIGCALSGKAAEGLGASAGIKDCRSISALEYAWKQGRDRLKRGDVLVIDEAGLVGTRQMNRLLKSVTQAQAKLVLVGDSEQLQAVEAGAPFRAMAKMIGKVEIEGIRRQKEVWQREASVALAQGRVAVALSAYTESGCVHGYQTKRELMAHVMRAWGTNEINGRNEQIIVAYTRSDVEEANLAIRKLRKATGRLGWGKTLDTDAGQLEFCVGDRLMFTKNQRKMGVKNGTLGTVEGVGLTYLQIKLDDGRKVKFDPGDFQSFTHGYAVTVHKAQGLGCARVHMVAARAYDRHATYVAMTRHKDRLDVYYAHEDFANSPGMSVMLARERHKKLALDFLQVERKAKAVGKEKVPDVEVSSGLKRYAPDLVAGGKAAELLAQIRELEAQVGQRLTLKGAIRSLPEMMPVREALRDAVGRREFWREQVAAAVADKSFLGRLGLAKPSQIADPASGALMAPAEGLAEASKQVQATAREFQRLEGSAYVVQRGEALMAMHVQAVESAKPLLDAAIKQYDAVQRELQAADERAVERGESLSPAVDDSRHVER